MPPVGFEPTISAGERPQTYALDRAATETDSLNAISSTIWRENLDHNSLLLLLLHAIYGVATRKVSQYYCFRKYD